MTTQKQPEFVDEIIVNVKEQLAKLELTKQLAVKTPNYTLPIGVKNNFFRTVLSLETVLEIKEGETPVLPSDSVPEDEVQYSVNISNNYQVDGEALIICLSFETKTAQVQTASTRHYLPKEHLDKRTVKVAYRPKEELDNDIVSFLTTGVVPSGNPANK